MLKKRERESFAALRPTIEPVKDDIKWISECTAARPILLRKDLVECS
jgi:hypothetical protein